MEPSATLRKVSAIEGKSLLPHFLQHASGIPKNFVDLSRFQSPDHLRLTVNRCSFIHKRSCRWIYMFLGVRIIHSCKVARFTVV
ncbi:hypothetical protein K435DRAFT_786889, partial [Dendrothele bispora CBS 962.96]